MKIGTHSGHFHADEALAVWMLKKLPAFADAKVVRSRNIDVLTECDIVVDVGGKYEAPKWYDHHQREFNTTFDDKHTITKLSSAGLVYKHYGREVIKLIVEESVKNFWPNEDNLKKRRSLDFDEITDVLYPRIYESFIEAVDALDNGVNAYTEQPKYSMRQMQIQSVVNNLNPSSYESQDDELVDSLFVKASDLMGMAFHAEVRSSQLGWYFSRDTVQQAYRNRLQYDSKGRIMVMDDFANWKEHLEDLEKGNTDGLVLYVLYPSADSYRVQAVAKEPGSFESRKPLQWCGLRDNELSEAAGIADCVFVHASGFIGGNKTREGAIKMAQKSL